MTQRFETFVSEKKEYQQEQSKLKWEKDSNVKQMKKAQAQLDVYIDSVKASSVNQILFSPTLSSGGEGRVLKH